jgi:hypothetical protein
MSETGGNDTVANGGMKTKITIVNGVDGLTPDMLRAHTDGNRTPTPPTTRSTHWDSEMGFIRCRECGATWPCHFAPWLAGNQSCTKCGQHEALEWGPT